MNGSIMPCSKAIFRIHLSDLIVISRTTPFLPFQRFPTYIPTDMIRQTMAVAKNRAGKIRKTKARCMKVFLFYHILMQKKGKSGAIILNPVKKTGQVILDRQKAEKVFNHSRF